MNKTLAAAHVSVPFAVVVGVSLATLAVVGTGHGHYPVAAAPKATVTTTVPPATQGSSSPPAASGTPRATAGVVVLTSQRHVSAPGKEVRQEPTTPSRPAPKPSPAPTASGSSGGGLTLRLPLGVLPEVDLTVGGNR